MRGVCRPVTPARKPEVLTMKLVPIAGRSNHIIVWLEFEAPSAGRARRAPFHSVDSPPDLVFLSRDMSIVLHTRAQRVDVHATQLSLASLTTRSRYAPLGFERGPSRLDASQSASGRQARRRQGASLGACVGGQSCSSDTTLQNVPSTAVTSTAWTVRLRRMRTLAPETDRLRSNKSPS